MARVQKPPLSWDALFFHTPHQKVLRFLSSQREATYSLRVLSTKLKAVRGLGGLTGLEEILAELEQAGFVSFIDNGKGIRVQDDHPSLSMLRRLWALSEFEGLFKQLEPMGKRGIVTDAAPGEVEFLVVSEKGEEIRTTIEQHPSGKLMKPLLITESQWDALSKKDPKLYVKAQQGSQVWGTIW